MSNPLPPVVCSRIVRWAHRYDLPALARTSRALQHAAEARMYESLELVHSPAAQHICTMLAGCARAAAHVRSFLLAPAPGTRRGAHTWAQRAYWDAVRGALANMPALDYLYLSHPAYTDAYVLAPGALRFRLAEARLHVVWDAHVAAFLEAQDALARLYIADVADDGPRPALARDALPALRCFEGPLVLVGLLRACPLTHLKVPVEDEDAQALLPSVLPALCRFKALRALSIATIPEEISIECMLAISAACPQLLHLSHVPLPCEHKPVSPSAHMPYPRLTLPARSACG